MDTEIIKIWDEANEVKGFRLSKLAGYQFIPGQYCMWTIESESRPFTMTSVPSSEYLEFTIKKMGDFTSNLFELKPGYQLEMSEPHGSELNFDETIKDDIVFIAGGSGITPFICAIRYAFEHKMTNKLILLYGNRTQDDIIFKNELDQYDMKVVHVLSNEDWSGEQGYVDQKIIDKYVKDPINKTWYICGPPPMTAGMRKILDSIGVTKIRIEPWELPG